MNDIKELFVFFKQTIKEMSWCEKLTLIADIVLFIAIIWGGFYIITLAGVS